jgi:CheY-like chemotaxis protein
VRILAVDDEPDVQNYFIDLSKQFNTRCDVAAAGQEALDLIRQNGPYDLYFVDWNMPEMNGIELSRRIKENCVNNPVIVMISSIEWMVIESEARMAGVDRFLPKPLFASAIANCLNEYLGKSEAVKAEAETGSFEGYHILLAEDVEINREIVLALLEPTLVEIDCAENGRKAVELFSRNPERYDMIFMDLQMPEVDGLEATRRIRALDVPQAKAVPIIAMTANVFKEDIEHCLEAGMNDHVGKPLDFDEVLKKLRRYLPKRPF